ncbi:MAG: ATP-binding protein, partial [Thermoleophilaceae bacterium]
TEAFANAVQHGEAGTDGIHLRVMTCEEGLCVEVCDWGSFDGRVGPPPEDGLSGRGLPLMRAVTDRFELVPDDSRTRVRLGKRRAAAA